MDEDSVNITKHKHLLEDIRNGGTPDDDSGRGHQHDREESSSGNTQRVEGSPGGIARGEERTSQSNGASSGLREGVRPPQSKDVNATPRPRHRKPKEREHLEEKKPATRAWLPFLDRQPERRKSAPVKLFTADEVETKKERMAFIYKKMFSFGDDILEVIVRDHEDVEIWAVTDEQAEELATNHLEEAMYDQQAARSARKLLEIYGRLYFYQIMLPRGIASARYIDQHKGFSFR